MSQVLNRAGMAQTLDQLVEDVRTGLATKMHVRGATLAGQVRKAGRRLPRTVRRDAEFLVQVLALAQNPKLARQVNMRRAQAAHRHILLHLETVDLGAERRAIALQIAASVALAILVTSILLITVLAWRGFV